MGNLYFSILCKFCTIGKLGGPYLCNMEIRLPRFGEVEYGKPPKLFWHKAKKILQIGLHILCGANGMMLTLRTKYVLAFYGIPNLLLKWSLHLPNDRASLHKESM